MKTALLSLGGDPAPVLALLQGRGLDLQVFTGVEALLSAVAQDPTLELVLVEGDSQTLLLDGLPKLRRFPYYLYLVYLADKTQADLEGFYGAGIDEVLPKNLSPSPYSPGPVLKKRREWAARMGSASLLRSAISKLTVMS